MVQETGYPIKILSNLLIVSKISPYFVTGLTDAEGSFSIKMSKVNSSWRAQLSFSIGMHIRDKDLLVQFSKFFGVGTLRTTNNTIYYTVRSINDLMVVVSHFKNYPLQTKKGADFELFCKALDIMKNKTHLSNIEYIVALKASIN